MYYMSSFGNKLAECRKAKNLSQKELAEIFSTPHTTIGKYERDEIKPSIDIASKLADVLNISLDYLTGKTDIELDNSIIKRVVEIQNLPKEDKAHILYALDGLLQNVRTKLAFGK